jgi:hypothetical protein
MSREYVLHALDTRVYTLEHADSKETVSAPTIDGLGRKLAEHAPVAPSIRLDTHCEQYLPADTVRQIMLAYDRAKAHEQVKAK